MIRRFREVTKDLFRGSAPSPLDLSQLKDKYGIKKIVSLDEDAGNRIDKATKLLGMEHIIIPLDWRKPSLGLLLQHNLKDLFLKGGPTFVHCIQGKDRTGLAIALVQCKYLGKSPEEVIKEAKELGFGIGLDPRVSNFYEKIIKACGNKKDDNDADIVSNEREYIGDNRDSFLDESRQSSFAPFLDATRNDPTGAVYDPIDEQSLTRSNYKLYKMKEDIEEKDDLPLVGQFYNSGLRGAGPVELSGGFISE